MPFRTNDSARKDWQEIGRPLGRRARSPFSAEGVAAGVVERLRELPGSATDSFNLARTSGYGSRV